MQKKVDEKLDYESKENNNNEEEKGSRKIVSVGNYVTCHRSTRVKIIFHKVYACQQLGPDMRFLDSLKEFQAASRKTKMN